MNNTDSLVLQSAIRSVFIVAFTSFAAHGLIAADNVEILGSAVTVIAFAVWGMINAHRTEAVATKRETAAVKAGASAVVEGELNGIPVSEISHDHAQEIIARFAPGK